MINGKDTFYFPHDYNSRHDRKLEKLLIKLGPGGIGIYWCLIEMLYEENGTLNIADIDIYAIALRTDSKSITTVINDFELFKNDGIAFWSDSQRIRQNAINEKRGKMSVNAQKRWSNAKAMQLHCKSNDIILKEIKLKEIKGNNIPPSGEVETNHNEAFDKLWQAYPLKKGRGDALAAFKQVFEDRKSKYHYGPVPVEDVITALNRQKQGIGWLKEEGKYIPHPATWLRAHRWLDEITAEEIDKGNLEIAVRKIKKEVEDING